MGSKKEGAAKEREGRLSRPKKEGGGCRAARCKRSADAAPPAELPPAAADASRQEKKGRGEAAVQCRATRCKMGADTA
eukprot:scaffold6865_cov97-Isochrysis_galbana.AAC.1